MRIKRLAKLLTNGNLWKRKHVILTYIMEREMLVIKYWVYVLQRKTDEKVVTTRQVALLLLTECSS